MSCSHPSFIWLEKKSRMAECTSCGATIYVAPKSRRRRCPRCKSTKRTVRLNFCGSKWHKGEE